MEGFEECERPQAEHRLEADEHLAASFLQVTNSSPIGGGPVTGKGYIAVCLVPSEPASPPRYLNLIDEPVSSPVNTDIAPSLIRELPLEEQAQLQLPALGDFCMVPKHPCL